jgi:hypothetical protein
MLLQLHFYIILTSDIKTHNYKQGGLRNLSKQATRSKENVQA